MEFHMVPLNELHDVSVDCDCGYEVMSFSNGVIVIHQPEGGFAFETLMNQMGSYGEWQLCEVRDE